MQVLKKIVLFCVLKRKNPKEIKCNSKTLKTGSNNNNKKDN